LHVGGRIHAGQKEQFDANEPFALACPTTALCHVEREPARIVSSGARLLGGGEELPDMIEQTGVGRQIRPRRATDRLLINNHQPFNFLQTADDLAA
jgi:hypothetical protein